jgi:ABC-type transport system substrate-binding protein
MSENGANYWDPRRRQSRRQVIRRGALGAVGLWLVACGAPAAPTARGGPAAPPARLGGTIRTGTTANERNLDPQQLNGGDGSHGSSNCYNQLLTFKWGPDVKVPAYIVIGDLAQSWTQADDLTYTFKLRPDVKWHNIAPVNGRELVADDVVYSCQRIRELKSFSPLLAGITKMDAVDKSTLKLTLEKPNADLLANLASYYLKIVAGEAVAVNGSLDNGPTIGTGPWIQDEFVPQGKFTAKRNPDYFIKDLPYADRFESIRTAGDITLIVNGFRSGNLDVAGSGLTTDHYDELSKAITKLKVTWMGLDRAADELGLNANFAPFKNKKVRQAIRKAIDWDAQVALNKGRAIITSGVALPAPEWDLPQDELKKARTRDVAGAKALLKEAGFENGFDLKFVVPNYLAGAARAGRVVPRSRPAGDPGIIHATTERRHHR